MSRLYWLGGTKSDLCHQGTHRGVSCTTWPLHIPAVAEAGSTCESQVKSSSIVSVEPSTNKDYLDAHLLARKKCSSITSRHWRVTLKNKSITLVTDTVGLAEKSQLFNKFFEILTTRAFKKALWKSLTYKIFSWRIYFRSYVVGPERNSKVLTQMLQTSMI